MRAPLHRELLNMNFANFANFANSRARRCRDAQPTQHLYCYFCCVIISLRSAWPRILLCRQTTLMVMCLGTPHTHGCCHSSLTAQHIWDSNAPITHRWAEQKGDFWGLADRFETSWCGLQMELLGFSIQDT